MASTRGRRAPLTERLAAQREAGEILGLLALSGWQVELELTDAGWDATARNIGVNGEDLEMRAAATSRVEAVWNLLRQVVAIADRTEDRAHGRFPLALAG